MNKQLIKTELDRISNELRSDPNHPSYDELYAAQQALAWAVDPSAVASPANMILRDGKHASDCPACDAPAYIPGACMCAPQAGAA